MRKMLAATALLSALSWGSATAQTPPTSEPKPTPQPNMMGEGMSKMDAGCPMMKKMAAMEDRLKKLEQRAPQQQ